MSLGRNDPCPCGSGRKVKQCCGDRALRERARMLEAVQRHQASDLEAAAAIYRELLGSRGERVDALHYLGLIAYQQGRYAEARARISEAIAQRPNVAGFHVNFGNAAKRDGDATAAEAAYRRAIALDARSVAALINLGNLLCDHNRWAEAVPVFQAAVKLDDGRRDARLGLARACYEAGRYDEADRWLREWLARQPEDVEALRLMGACLQSTSRMREALGVYDRLMSLKPDAVIEQTRLFLRSFTVPDREQTVVAHRDWAARYTRAGARPSRNPPRDDGRLRVGYLSPDLRRHAMRFFVRPIFAHHDRARFDVHAFHTGRVEDEVSAELKALVDRWHAVGGLDDDALCALLREEGIDILVELAGHTSGGRLAALARWPVPAQATMLGYFHTLGIPAIRYRIADAAAIPPEMESWFDEQILRLPASQWCYAPDPDPPPIRARRTGFDGLVLGCFHNLSKATPEVIAVWRTLLERLPAARIAIVPWSRLEAEHVRRQLVGHGIADDRLLEWKPQGPSGYLDLYNDVDLSLDVFPYAGGTVSLDSLWMGVPFVSLALPTPTSRGGASILTAFGRSEWLAHDESGFVERVIALAGAGGAGDAARRAALRAELTASPLMDGRAYVRALEGLYERMYAAQ